VNVLVMVYTFDRTPEVIIESKFRRHNHGEKNVLTGLNALVTFL